MEPTDHAVHLIVAYARNGVIGHQGSMPWHFSEDLKHFRRTTTGHTLVMGRKTADSLGSPLSNRRHIVITRAPALSQVGWEFASSLESAIELARTSGGTTFVIGGGEIFAQAIPLVTDAHITLIDSDFKGDVYFDPTSLRDFDVVSRTPGETRELTFLHLRRREFVQG